MAFLNGSLSVLLLVFLSSNETTAMREASTSNLYVAVCSVTINKYRCYLSSKAQCGRAADPSPPGRCSFELLPSVARTFRDLSQLFQLKASTVGIPNGGKTALLDLREPSAVFSFSLNVT